MKKKIRVYVTRNQSERTVFGKDSRRTAVPKGATGTLLMMDQHNPCVLVDLDPQPKFWKGRIQYFLPKRYVEME